jgi:hypothetical protein
MGCQARQGGKQEEAERGEEFFRCFHAYPTICVEKAVDPTVVLCCPCSVCPDRAHVARIQTPTGVSVELQNDLITPRNVHSTFRRFRGYEESGQVRLKSITNKGEFGFRLPPRHSTRDSVQGGFIEWKEFERFCLPPPTFDGPLPSPKRTTARTSCMIDTTPRRHHCCMSIPQSLATGDRVRKPVVEGKKFRAWRFLFWGC